MSDSKAKSLIEQLLNKVPEMRLAGGYKSLKKHAWFNKFDWQ